MSATKPFVAEIRSRGQLTIPKEVREVSHLEEGQIVSVLSVGDAVIITPKRLDLEEARRQIRKILTSTGVSAERVLEGLGEAREAVYKATYGKRR